MPWWYWKKDGRDLRECEEKMLEQREVYKLQTVDHDQVTAYESTCGDREERHPPGRQSLEARFR